MCLVLCLCYVYLCLCADKHAMVYVWSQRTACGGQTSPSIVWVMGVELTLPGLATSPLPTEPSQNSLKEGPRVILISGWHTPNITLGLYLQSCFFIQMEQRTWNRYFWGILESKPWERKENGGYRGPRVAAGVWGELSWLKESPNVEYGIVGKGCGVQLSPLSIWESVPVA